MLIPHQQLDPETLTRLIEDLVTREGTDNGDETPLSTRVERVQTALARNEAGILFDQATQQCQLVLRQHLPQD